MPLSVIDVRHVYSPGTPFEHIALDGVSLAVQAGQVAAIIGHTGSGKSTLVQTLNGLIRPTSGSIYIGDVDITAKGADLKAARRSIGLVFQYPEYQLFEETVAKDIAFGPRNMKLDEAQVDERVREACALVGLDWAEVAEKSPFELSGGQKRRVAIAGVLAMRPEILVLDEPTAGLDPRGREELLSLMEHWHEGGRSLIMVSHSMDDVARLADIVFVLSRGRMAISGTPAEVFRDGALLESIGLGLPRVAALADALRECGVDVPADCFSMDELEARTAAALDGALFGVKGGAR